MKDKTNKGGTKNRLWTIIGVIVGIVAGFAVAWGVGVLVKGKGSSTGEVSDSRLAKSIEQIIDKSAGQLPMRVDQYTTLISMESPQSRTITYRYRVEMSADDVDKEIFAESMKPVLVANVAESAELVFLRNNHVTFEYQYVDPDGVSIGNITIAPDDYENYIPQTFQTNHKSQIEIEQFEQGGEFSWD